MEIISRAGFSFAKIVSKVNPPAYSATLIIKGTFLLTPDGKAERTEESDPPLGDLYVDNDPEKSCIHESDFAIYKPRADLILSGKCHPPSGEPVPGCRVTFQVADRKKSLYVFGDRRWTRGPAGTLAISKPEPFTEMPLIYENSFGGSDYKDNPHGKGATPLTTESGREFWPLPNIEEPRHLIASPDSRPDPAGFAPMGRMWPKRMKGKVGTYDEQWLKERWPYFPIDFDWGYFNSAPPDMQLNRYLNGDESLYFEHLHPQIPQYRAQLPGVRARCFLNEQSKGQVCFREVKLNLDTLWADMEEEKLHLIWRGVAEVETEELEEIEHALVVSEPLEEEPKPLEHYQLLLTQCLKEQEDELADKEPEMEIQPIDDSWVKEMEKNFARMEEDFKKIEAQAAESEKAARKMLKEAGIDPAKLDQTQQAAQKMSLRDILTQAAAQEEKLRKSNPELAKKLPPPMTAEEIDELERDFQFEPFPEFDSFPEPLTREDCEARLLKKEPFEHENLSGLDLSGLDFSNAICRNTNFEKANLKEVNFSGADLSGSNLARCGLAELNFQGAKLVNADLSGADLSSADLRDAVLDDADFSAAVLENARLDNVHGFRTIFVTAALKEAQFADATLEEADFEGADLESVNFERAVLRDASVEGTQGKGINMQGADLTGLHASEGPDFTGGLFKGAQAGGSIWEDALLEGADFSTANLIDADFTNASLKQACFIGADLRTARFEKADLTETVMRYINLFQGSLEKTKLIRTDLRDSNLYEVEFYLAEIDHARFEGSNLKMTKLAGKR